ncbi:MAG: hypothetical protein ACM3JC_05920 [Rudaea sp.]
MARKLVYVAAVILLAGCVPIGVRVQNMLAHAAVDSATLPGAGVRSIPAPVAGMRA